MNCFTLKEVNFHYFFWILHNYKCQYLKGGKKVDQILFQILSIHKIKTGFLRFRARWYSGLNIKIKYNHLHLGFVSSEPALQSCQLKSGLTYSLVNLFTHTKARERMEK